MAEYNSTSKKAEEFITKGKRKYLYCFDNKLKKRLEILKQPNLVFVANEMNKI